MPEYVFFVRKGGRPADKARADFERALSAVAGNYTFLGEDEGGAHYYFGVICGHGVNISKELKIAGVWQVKKMNWDTWTRKTRK